MNGNSLLHAAGLVVGTLLLMPLPRLESVERLGAAADSAAVRDRREFGGSDTPGLTQRVDFTATAGDVHRDLVQTQVSPSPTDVEEPSRRAVILLALTATATRYNGVGGDFQEFPRSVRPDAGKAG
ncbi:hypothetical protein [Streptomyces sp. NPDC053755]|uniref:hypothetical protein n=1 Tax=Streptomyces sp. NPDC053755 TaxID=3155815 RepID=UPI00342C30B2